ncbi:MAG: Polynucleotide adenylyltransferase/metal-dependent phosphohydrolase [candidate division TM6 bacterium GW2011_GWF2_32_72]|nr:MAG: Polynucleotide adenylyltransferase/metal-dependent phosphohydrolase [candidate division TM6 bacterium GW2011_GWF2_32_72]
MEYKKISLSIQESLEQILKKHLLVKEVVEEIFKHGGTVYLVGGAVRDLLLGLPAKDLDIEVHGVELDKLQKILEKFGRVDLVGKSFGVLRLCLLDIDWSVPRKDSKGRKPVVEIDSNMRIEDAFRRRDLTINSMGINLKTFELVDPFYGLQDLHKNILRATDKKLFEEDPLRFYRVLQFVGRFGMHPDKELDEICSKINLNGVANERIEEELKKLFLKSAKPSLAFLWLKKIGRLQELFPEIYALINLDQGTKYHPEGDVFEHTMQVLDAAAGLAFESENEKLGIMWAALLHDIGKISTSQKKLNGHVSSYGHAQEGGKIAQKMLKRFISKRDLIDLILKLIIYHMQPSQLVAQKAKSAAYKRLANNLSPETSIKVLCKLLVADALGRNPKKGEPLPVSTNIVGLDDFIKAAEQAFVFENKEEPVLQGRDLLDQIHPGPELGKILKHAYEIQIEEGIKNKDELKRRVLD